MGRIKNKTFGVGYSIPGTDNKTSAIDTLQEIKKIKEKKQRYEAPVIDIPYEDLVPNSTNRNADRDIKELADSIMTFGVIHPPRVKKNENGKYVLTSGERRWRAIGLIRELHPDLFQTVQCTCADETADDLDEEARLIIANNEVCEPTAEERRKSIQRLTEIYEAKKERGDDLPDTIANLIADDLSISARQVYKMMNINKNLIPNMQDVYDNNGININDAAKVSKMDPIFQQELADKYESTGEIHPADIAYVRDADNKFKTESPEKKRQLDELRKTQAVLETEAAASDEENPAAKDEIQSIKSSIEELTQIVKESVGSKQKKQDTKSDDGKHIILQNTIARIERAQDQIVKQVKGVTLDDMERTRITKIIEQLQQVIAG